MRLIIVNGCFDGIHAAHVHLLETAKALGDRLIVLINSDASIEQRKERTPVNCLRDRIAVLKALRCVDGVISFGSEEELRGLLELLRPTFLVKGEEYRDKPITGADVMRKHGGAIVFVPSLTEQRSSDVRRRAQPVNA